MVAYAACREPAQQTPTASSGRPVSWLSLAALLIASGAIAQEAESLNTVMVGSLRVEAPWDPDSGEHFSTTDLYVAGDFAYMGSSNNMLHVIDISRPEAMRVAAQVEMPGPALDVKVSGNLAVVAIQKATDTHLGVVVVDISEPRAPRILSEFSNEFWFGVHNLFLHEDRAYLAHSANRGLTILDISNPSRPFISGSWLGDREEFGGVIHDVFIRDGMAYLSDLTRGLGGLVILDLADPDRPAEVSYYSVPEGLHNAWQEGNYVFCNQEFGGWQQPLHIIDIADPGEPVAVGTFRARKANVGDAQGPHNAWAQDGLLYWAYYDAGLRVLDVADPPRPVEIGYYRTPQAWGAQPHTDGLVYVADAHLSTLLALRFDKPSFAVRSASLSASSFLSGGERMIEVRATVAPFGIPGTGQIRRVSARLLPDRDARRWDLSETGPNGEGETEFTGRVRLPADLPSGPYHVEVRVEDDMGRIYPYSNLPFAVRPAVDLAIMDESLATGVRTTAERGASEPRFTDSGPIFRGAVASAFEVKSGNAEGWDVGLHFAEPVDFLGYTHFHLAFHPGDVSGRTLTMFLGEYRIRLAGRGSPISWRLDLDLREWQQVDIPLDLLQRDQMFDAISFSGNLEGTFFIDDMRLVADETAVSTVLAEQGPGQPRAPTLGQNYPNPFNGGTSIRFSLPRDADVNLSLYNLAGQKVVTLARGKREAGEHTLRWNGDDAAGGPVGSGIYLYRLRVGNRVVTRKLLLVQ